MQYEQQPGMSGSAAPIEESCGSSAEGEHGSPQGGGAPSQGSAFEAGFAAGMAQAQGQMGGQPQAPGNGQTPMSGNNGQAAYSEPGPDMGQPHYSAQYPGTNPYQGAPMSTQTAQEGWYGAQIPGFYPGQAPPQYAQGQAVPPGGAQMNPGYAQAESTAPGAAMGQENRYGELFGLIQDAANGSPDVSRFMNFFQSTSSDFWKGALVGVAATLLLTNDTVKGALAGAFGGLMGFMGKSAEEQEAEEDRKAEERAAKEGQA
ncbi:MAG: hypothetical protein D6E12_15870 [Desulfovibrio sp.]|nr:MAG: hypothetical protein D6E12_15870 [Desulfovibrio sp.]